MVEYTKVQLCVTEIWVLFLTTLYDRGFFPFLGPLLEMKQTYIVLLILKGLGLSGYAPLWQI